jgi:undecaprenyl pyrophosphate synthase
MSSYLNDIDRTNVPDHVAIVMDGNGRWATNEVSARRATAPARKPSGTPSKAASRSV